MTAPAWAPAAPVLVVTGHYGVGKTNLALNLALDAAARGLEVAVADLDVVNPFFRSSDYRALLDEAGVRVIAPVFAGTNLDGPSLSGTILPAIERARAGEGRLLIVDAGGDDAGATALGRFARAVAAGPYEMLYVVNRSRVLSRDAGGAVAILREIEAACRLRATAIANNTHLKAETDLSVLEAGVPFAEAVAQAADLPIAFTAVPAELAGPFADRQNGRFRQTDGGHGLYPVRVYAQTPWE
ncbi:nucleotide-binding protein [Gordonibacter sp. An230]|uniref:nucleotide-binding protein n=1 Tax=Gordonibacter sp. An230 TaxID=1965592 RepID=UPI000B38AC90|nr:hypothetical protein [Gordonibacter sp. An230]